MKKCIVCDSHDIQEFMNLGNMALANNFLTKEELAMPEPKYPLRVGFCHNCGHVQLMEHVPPSTMFENYLYISSASDTLKKHLYDLARIVAGRYQLQSNDLVIDVGSNDGTLLSEFRRQGVKTLGVDPARNLAELARQVGVETYTALFGLETAEQIVKKYGKATVITATNTFLHIQNPKDFIQALDMALAPNGVFVIEFHYLVDLLEQSAFDTIYHEHVSYWALRPLITLFEKHGMRVVHVERLPLHHGQLRVFVHRKGHGEIQPSVGEILEMERIKGIDQFETYKQLAQNATRIKQDLRRTIEGVVARGKRVVGYGAPAKANTLLGFLEIGPDIIEYIADRSPLKQGRYTPGMHIPVVAPERLLEDQPDYVLLLAWNFAEEIFQQQAEYHRRGGQFIVPIPEVKFI